MSFGITKSSLFLVVLLHQHSSPQSRPDTAARTKSKDRLLLQAPSTTSTESSTRPHRFGHRAPVAYVAVAARRWEQREGMRGAGKAEEQGRQQHGWAGRRHHEWDGSVVESSAARWWEMLLGRAGWGCSSGDADVSLGDNRPSVDAPLSLAWMCHSASWSWPR
jgi:hypothetical protein